MLTISETYSCTLAKILDLTKIYRCPIHLRLLETVFQVKPFIGPNYFIGITAAILNVGDLHNDGWGEVTTTYPLGRLGI